MHIVLVEPEIPQNTGNIARTCAATGAKLHLIRPLGFELSDKYLKRAGLDYWRLMEYTIHDSLEAFLAEYPDARLHLATTKAPRDYCQARYGAEDFLVFGKETKGLDEDFLAKNYEKCIRIPMREEARSLNLSNSVAIVLYEALRQQGFPGLSGTGHLHHTPEPAGEWKDYV
ncbi:MAG: tRNA (uridine(34)/cytosine(34)/5-carboxymethylaminomethyluridine(34)-2'-O)-methyltransferase TrmL [Christensenellales bacterium]|nr:tRNA (uridine(34)/cytosine(34)/5-carboxymethylaminomethyluridine(34)-2'-O)-methyltransferase TrmL [Eubacteriales bacterium]MEE0158197.1 tRNA (uridine(34)/cytosine(34)/5-carboxymethylaminomethyluridine(34)-2'-O)-methyltransferase TrmL [Christensenellales bacterium]